MLLSLKQFCLLFSGRALARFLSTSEALRHSPDENQGSKSTFSAQLHKGQGQTASTDAPDRNIKKATTPVGRLDDKWEGAREKAEPPAEVDVYGPFPGGKNPQTGEIGGPRGPEPTRYGDWERKGRVIDF